MQSSESTITAVEAGKRHDPQMLGVGATLQNGKYTIEAQLSHGGFGMTYKVLDRDRNKHFALKELFLKGINERCSDRTTISLVPTSDTEQFNQNRDLFESQVRSFKREGDRMIDLQHPNIVRVYTIFEENDTVYYVMDYIDGESLDARLKHLGRPLSEDEVMQLLPQVLSALEYTHQHNIRHLDIKPANIMVGKDGHAVLIDFGASKQVKATDQMTSTLSSMALTRGYAPMEQVEQNTRQIGPWTDFYALGATLYKLLTNIETLPTASEIMGGYEFQYPDSVSRKMRDLISWLMQPACVKRPQSVAEIREFLGNKVQAGNKAVKDDVDETVIPTSHLVSDETVIPDKAEPQPKPEPKSYIGIYILALCTVAVLCLSAWWFISRGNASSEPMGETVSQSPSTLNSPLDLGRSTLGEPLTAATQTFTANGVSFKMIRVEGGTFTMGSEDGDSDEKPTHRVTLSSYYIGETEVTQELWEAVMGTTVRQQRDKVNTSNSLCGIGYNYPMYYISWDECKTFISKLNSLTGKSFRLPTEAEWEFAARGGIKSQGYKYSGSNTIGNVAWYDGNSGEETHPVKTKSPNELGIYDMSGNVCEWCQDWYGDYGTLSQTNPTGPSSGSFRVNRGGSCFNYAPSCRVANRDGLGATYRSINLGLRLAL